MGRRGRDRAKQARVARELKYHTPDTDLLALQQELSGRPHLGLRSDGDVLVDDDVDQDDDPSPPARR